MLTNRTFVILVVATATACAPKPPPPPQPSATEAHPHYQPAPMPFVHYQQRGTNFTGYDVPVPPKMPFGTGAVPVSNSSFRGSVVTGIKESF